MQQGPWTFINSYDRRFGPDFFKQVPEKPGVYWMQDSRRSLLFASKASNLRRSLSLFRFVQPQHSSKRLIQLMDEVRSLGWSPTETDKAAELLERQMVLRHQPVFNKYMSSPDKHGFLVMKTLYPYIQMQASSERPLIEGLEIYGIFKSRLCCHKALTSMNRLLWWIGHPGQFTALPKPLAKSLCPNGQKIEIHIDEKSFLLLMDFVRDYWAGRSLQLVELFEDTHNDWAKNDANAFFVNWLKQDITVLKSYFPQGPLKHSRVQKLFSQTEVEPSWLDEIVLLS